MNRKARIFCFLVTLAALGGCSSGPTAKESKQAGTALEKIQGKAQVGVETSGAADAALNAGGPTVYIRVGMRRYRLFFRTAADVVDGNDYVVEGVYAQKAIDDIGDPDQGKNGYPLQSSCERVIKMAWSDLAFDELDADTSFLGARIKRYPARPIFLVVRIRPATSEESSAISAEAKKAGVDEDENVPEISVAADKQRALLIEGPTVQTAPLWDPAGETVSCKVLINPEGQVSALETGVQLCESVPWSQFRYQPTLKDGHPAKVKTEVEVRFDPRK